jgi:hypothetical protein
MLHPRALKTLWQCLIKIGAEQKNEGLPRDVLLHLPNNGSLFFPTSPNARIIQFVQKLWHNQPTSPHDRIFLPWQHAWNHW